jgi:hypothetical protein
LLPSSGDSFLHLIKKRRSHLGFVTYLLTYLRIWMNILYYILFQYVLSKLAKTVMLLTFVWEMSINPSFTVWVQNILRPGILLYILTNFSICSLKSHWHNIIIIGHIYCFCMWYVFSNTTGPFCAHFSKKVLKYVFCQNLLNKSSNTLELLEDHQEQSYCTADWLMSSYFAVMQY